MQNILTQAVTVKYEPLDEEFEIVKLSGMDQFFLVSALAPSMVKFLKGLGLDVEDKEKVQEVLKKDIDPVAMLGTIANILSEMKPSDIKTVFETGLKTTRTKDLQVDVLQSTKLYDFDVLVFLIVQNCLLFKDAFLRALPALTKNMNTNI